MNEDTKSGTMLFDDPSKLRDWFAGMAMQGDWAAQDGKGSPGMFTHAMPPEALLNCAMLYYRMADAMLRARKGGAK